MEDKGWWVSNREHSFRFEMSESDWLNLIRAVFGDGIASRRVSSNGTALALTGDDRPAPNGDEWETEMLRMLSR